MADNHTKEVRSYNMSRIKATNTKPEKIVRKYLFSRGLRYRKNDKRFKSKPDIVMPKYKTIVFVHGCFWHLHENCPDSVMPKSNLDYWKPKLIKNSERDKTNISALRECGWKVIVVWECELKKDLREERLKKLYGEIINEGNQ